MSASKNPDFWRSQEGAGENEKPKVRLTDDASPLTGDTPSVTARVEFDISDSGPRINPVKTPRPTASAPQEGPSRAPKEGMRPRATPAGNYGDDSSAKGPQSPTNSSPPRGSGNESFTKKPNLPGTDSSSATGAAGPSATGSFKGTKNIRDTAKEGVKGAAKGGIAGGLKGGPVGAAVGAGLGGASAAAKDFAKDVKAKKEGTASGSATPPPEVLSKETGKEALKEGLKQGAKGGVKGLATGPKGALLGAAVGAAAGVSDKINEAESARKQAGTRGTKSNASAALSVANDRLSDKALSSGRDALQRKYGASALGAKSKLPISAQQGKSIAKASGVVQREMTRKVVKTVVATVGFIVALILTMVTTIVGGITTPLAATVIPLTADDASCEAPESVTVGNASPGDKGTDQGLTPDAKKVRAYINSQWGGRIADIYGVRQGANAQDHASGRALDIMIPNYDTPAARELGWEISKYFQDNAKDYGITYLIFDNKFWHASDNPTWSYKGGPQLGPKEWAPYGSTGGPTDQHLDHVHISVEGSAATGTTPVSYNGQASSVDMTRATNITPLTRVPMVNAEDIAAAPTKYGLVDDATVRAKQIENAKAIIGMAKAIGFNQEGAVIAIMTAMTESDLINVGHGDDARNPDGSMNTSLGLFQQQHGKIGWGTAEEVMNPVHASQSFFLGTRNGNPGMESIPTWRSMDPWMVAQKVQRSAFSDGSNYKSKHEYAKGIVDALYNSTPAVSPIAGGTANESDKSANTNTSTDGCNTSTGGDGSIGSSQAGDTYPARNESYGRTALDYQIQSADGVAGGWRGECVDWAYWKLIEYAGLYGTHKVAAVGNATDIGPAMRQMGIPVDKNPVVGDAAYWTAGSGGSGSAGHIATVQAVNGDGTITIEEYNYGHTPPGDTPATGGGRYYKRTIPINSPTGYIHFVDPSKSKEENVANLISKGVLVQSSGTWPRK